MMATMGRHPLIDPPRFPSPDVYRSDPPSPRLSPTRHSRKFSKSGDTLLRNLSPTSTLRAFTAGTDETDGKSKDQLARSVEAASSAERAFGVRIAQTCKDIRAWHAEVEIWQWPGTFGPPTEAQRLLQMQRMLDERSLSTDTTLPLEQEAAQPVQFWGCLPGHLIVSYEKRVEDIRDALEELDVDSLKDYILSAHIQSKLDHTSDFDGSVERHHLPLKPQHLDDFTALITATVLQALPYLSRLNKLLNSWSVRLTVLRKVPGYTRELLHAQGEVESGWSEMSTHMDAQNITGQVDLDQLWTTFGSIRDALERKILKLGARLDSMLDDLEGRDETLPERWIDAFENLESSYGEWVIQTERELTGQNLHLTRRRHRSAQFEVSKGDVFIEERKASDMAGDFGHRDSATEVIGMRSGALVDAARKVPFHPDVARTASQDTLAPDNHFSAPLEQAESPVLGNGHMPDFGDDNEDTPSDSDDDRSMAGTENTTGDNEQDSAGAETSLSRTPSIQADRPITTKSPVRSRHVPIFIDYEDIRATSAPEVVTDGLDHGSMTSRQPSVSTESPVPEVGNRVRARAAFLNGGVEKSQSLQKTVSPPIVRPFEHASQAFTKLFQRSNSALRSRSNSTSSRASNRKGSGLGIKQETERTHHRSHPSVSSNRSFHTSDHIIPDDPSDIKGLSELSAEQVLGPDMRTSAELPHDADTVAELMSDHHAYVTPETQYGFEPSTGESKSTIESAWTSPSLSDFPENWPLPMGMNEEEISSPRKPLNSDFFEKMFVDSLPTTPNGAAGPHSHEENPLDRMMDFNSRTGVKESPLDNLMLASSQHRAESSNSSPAGLRSRSRPGHLRIGSKPSMQPWVGQTSEGTTPGSLKSDLSTPSVHDASAAEYFKSQEVQTPPLVSRTPSARTARLRKSPEGKVALPEGDTHNSPTSLASSSPSQGTGEPGHLKDALAMNERVPLLKRGSRASVTSIENYHRSQLKTIEIPNISRASSFSADRSPVSPVKSGSPVSPSYGSPSPELSVGRPHALSDLPTPVLSPSTNQSFAVNQIYGSEAPPLNLAIPKRRNMPALVAESSPSSVRSGNAKAPTSQTTPVKKMHKRSESTTEQLDRHVSRVLSGLPARIRFTPMSSTLNVDGVPNPNPASGSKTRPTLAQKPSRTNLTLSAAHTDISSNKKASANDPEVKLYHLTQEGKEQPIKLYVRLVGENERVMVRVGGGWADLGEYLRQYAEHHGRRTVSDGKFEIQGVTANGGSMKVGTGPKLRTPLSRPGSVLDRPNSALSQRRSSAGMSQTPNDVSSSPFSSPNPSSTMTPTPSNSSGSRPATADDAPPISPSSWAGAEVSLAGPASKKNGGLDEKKARWVEDMIGRAKQASTEKKQTEEKPWGDMGKIGGTRRMIFKHQKPESGRG